MDKEPSVIIGGITAFVMALIALLVAFGIDVSEEQRNAILGMIAPTIGIVLLMAAVIRQFVYSPKSVQQTRDVSYQAGVPPTEPKPDLPPPGGELKVGELPR